jgi:nitronate monooxygenase
MAFDFRDLAKPILVAPMAGGPSTPELAAAGTNAGGLGFVAAGYLTAEVFAERLTAARGLASGPIGANLFAPQPSAGTRADIERYAKALAPEAERYGAQLGEPRFDDDHWAAKIDVLLDVRPDVASFTFGVPSAEECGQLREAGITVVGTVTTLPEAQTAVDRGVDAVAVQGPSAGGHRGTFDPSAQPARGCRRVDDGRRCRARDGGGRCGGATRNGLPAVG